MPGAGDVRLLPHRAEHGDAAPVPGQGPGRVQPGPHGFGAGVVGVVDDGDAVGPFDDLQPAGRAPPGRVQPGGDLARVQPEHGRDGGGRHGVAHLVLADEVELDGGPAGGRHQLERGPPAPGRPHVLGPHRRLRRPAEAHDLSLRAARHAHDVRVVGVEQREPVRRQGRDQLALGLGDVGGPRSHALDVRAADVEHQPDQGRRDAGQVRQVALAARAHLQHQVAGAGVGPQHGERQPELVVERAVGGDRRRVPFEHLGQQVLGGGLAHRAGQADHDRADAAEHVPGQQAERDLDVLDHQRGHADGPGGEHGDRAGRDGDARVVVPVHPSAGRRGEEAAGDHLARVDRRRRRHQRPRIVHVVRGRADDLRDLLQRHGDHEPLLANARSMRRRSSSGYGTPLAAHALA